VTVPPRNALPEEGGILRRAWPFLRPDAWAIALALVLSPGIAALGLVQPWLIKTAIDKHIVPHVAEGLGTLALAYLGCVVLGYGLEVGYTIAVSWSGQRTIARMRRMLYRHALGLAQSFFDSQPTGKLLTRLTSDLEALGDALAAGAVTILLDVLVITGVLVAMFALNWRLSLALLALSPLLILSLEFLRRRLRDLFIETREAIASVNAYLAERVDGVQIVQLYRDEERSGAEFERRNRRMKDATSTSNVYDAVMFALVDGMASICIAAMLWYGSGLAARQLGLPIAPDLTPGIVVAFIDYLDRLFRPLRDLSGKITLIQRAIASLEKVFDLLDTRVAITLGSEPVAEVKGHLVMRGVHFRYRPDSEEVLSGIDLEVMPGEVVAVVGHTGAGKTTLVRLLDRSYDGYQGSITLDGVELKDIQRDELRKRVAAVRQDIQVFTEPVRFNVDLDNRSITNERRQEAAELVHADQFVHLLGWDHVLKERGSDLSVGQGQLLTFARTMAHGPDFIILDEATASVDSITEALVQDAIARILERKTVIVIAHRLSTIQSADRIVVMENGRVVESGRHDELLAKGGTYKALIDAAKATSQG